MGTELLAPAPARADIQIRPAGWTETFAVYSAKRLHRKRQQRLFAQDVAYRELRTGKKGGPRILVGQLDLFILVEHQFVALAKKQVEGLRDLVAGRFEAARTRQFNV